MIFNYLFDFCSHLNFHLIFGKIENIEIPNLKNLPFQLRKPSNRTHSIMQLTLLLRFTCATLILLSNMYLSSLAVILTLLCWPGANPGIENVFIEFLMPRKILSKFSKSSKMQFVCYVHSAGFSVEGGEGGCQGRGKNEENKQKNNKMGKNFQFGIDPSPRPVRAGGPCVTPSVGGDPACYKSTHTLPLRTVDKSGRVCSYGDGLNVDNFVANFTRFYIAKILANSNQKTTIFITCTGHSKSESNLFNFSNFLILLFIFNYKHGFK